MTQNDMILEHLRRHGSISPREALNEYGCMRLGARIWDLKRQGYSITAEREEGLNSRGEKCHWARYRMGGHSENRTA